MERDRIVNRRPGRPRSQEVHRAILAAAIALTREIGFDALTMEAVAARAGVGKATLYRRWSGKETLLAEAVGGIVAAIPEPDTGSAAGDLQQMMRVAEGMYGDPATGALLSGLVAAMARSEPIARAVRTGFVADFRATMRRILERARGRGELRADMDVELAIDCLEGPLFIRYLLIGGRVDEALTRGVIQIVLRGLAPAE